MKNNSIHFLFDYDDCEKPESRFGIELINKFGQADINDAKSIISVGGDGNLIRALRAANGRTVAGLLPPHSNSQGFWTNRGVDTPEGLLRFLDEAKSYEIRPLEARIHFSDGSTTLRHAYNDVIISQRAQELAADLKTKFGVDDIDMSAQSALMNLSVHFHEAVLGPQRIMGNGLLFSTAFGSTGANRSQGGPSIDIREEVIIMTGVSISDPVRGFAPIVHPAYARFDVLNSSPSKRPLQMTFDSFVIQTNKDGASIESIEIELSNEHCAHILLSDDPALRAYSSLIRT